MHLLWMIVIGLIVGAMPDEKAVVIQEVDPDSPAAVAGIAPGDVIRKLNGKEIRSIEEYKKTLSSVKSGQSVLFDLERGNTKLFIAFRMP